MAKRKIERKEEQINNYDLTTWSWSFGDISYLTEKTHKDYDFGIVMADTPGHSKKDGEEIKKQLQTEFLDWHTKENASECILYLSNSIKKKCKHNKRDWGQFNPLEISCISYTLFNKNKISMGHANAALPSAIRVTKGKIEYLQEKKSPQIGLIKNKEVGINLELYKGDIIVLITDGIFENPCFSNFAFDERPKLKKEEDIRIYREKNKRDFMDKLENLLIENNSKSSSEISDCIIKNLGNYFLPDKKENEEKYDDCTITIIKKVA